MNQGKRKSFDWLTYDVLVRWVSIMILTALSIIAVVWAAYALKFSANVISGDPAAWGQFGDFVGGVANPLLGFLTLVILSLTIILQSRQLSISANELELSRKELELTRGELSRSAKAQEQSEIALRAQAEASGRSAKLSATNFLLEHYKSERLSIEGSGVLRPRDPRLERKKELQRREDILVGVLDDLFREISGEDLDRQF